MQAQLSGAGLGWVFSLACFGRGKSIPISRILFWLWTSYIASGLVTTAVNSKSETSVEWLLSLYWTMYSTLGLLWHCRMLQLGLLRMAADTDIEVCTRSCSVVCRVSHDRHFPYFSCQRSVKAAERLQASCSCLDCKHASSVCSTEYSLQPS